MKQNKKIAKKCIILHWSDSLCPFITWSIMHVSCWKSSNHRHEIFLLKYLWLSDIHLSKLRQYMCFDSGPSNFQNKVWRVREKNCWAYENAHKKDVFKVWRDLKKIVPSISLCCLFVCVSRQCEWINFKFIHFWKSKNKWFLCYCFCHIRWKH